MSIAARTITLDAYVISGVPSGTYSAAPHLWSPKRVSETGFFAVDFGPQLDDGDAIVAAAVTVMPDVPGGLIVVGRAIEGSLVLAKIASGTAGQSYAVTMSAATVNQSLHPATVQLQVVA